MKIYNNCNIILLYCIIYFIILYYLKYFIIESLVSTVRIESWASSFLLGQPSILTVEPKHSIIVANESTYITIHDFRNHFIICFIPISLSTI